MTTPLPTRDGPLVSVLVPTFNRPRYLAEALESLVRQTYGRWEAFVVNDGGSPVADVVAALNDPRLVLIDRRENRGKAASLNEALRRAQGKYVAYLDDDDLYYPQHLGRLVDVLEAEPAGGCQAAYTDLYKTHCRILPDGRRQVLGKIVTISRDFDRFLLGHFNHVLHVSLMHRRDLLDRTGSYDEGLRVMIDWDMTRRLSFFTDFRHVPEVTGEFHGPVGECDRISYRMRLDKADYVRQVMTIRSARPPKPWPKMPDLSMILLADSADAATAMLRQIWIWTFMPYEVYVPLSPDQMAGFRSGVPHVVPVPVAPGASRAARLEAALARAQGDYAAVLSPSGVTVESLWIENALHAAVQHKAGDVAFALAGASGDWPAVVVRRDALVRSRRGRESLALRPALAAADITIREPLPAELPFQFDFLIQQAEAMQAEGAHLRAATVYQHLAAQGENRLWMRERAAASLFKAGGHREALDLCRDLNRCRPTAETLLLEAKILRRSGDADGAAALLERAETILTGKENPWN